MSDERFEGDEPREEEDAPEAPDEPGQPNEAPPPATWAGRRAQAGAEDEGAGDPGAELAGEHELPPIDSDAVADEGPEPADEFEFEDEEADEFAEEEAAAETPEDEADVGGPPVAETRETDTVTLADREEAREAAMEGLRARTAEHAAKRGITDPGPAPAAVPEAEAPEEKQEEPAAAPPPVAAKAPTAAPPAAGPSALAPGAPPPLGPGLDEGEDGPPRAGVLARFMAASFLIIASMAAATAVSILVYLTDIAKGLGGLPGLEGQLDEVEANAQNFLILGSDVRPDQEGKGLSDTTMLLRVDPEKNLITQLSIPRDLRVSIPGHGVDKFNAAYSYGGPKLTLQTLKQFTGDRVPIHHVVNIDFNGFADAVDAIGCVYIDVDRHYFNDNATAASFADQYAEIDIQAGYQRLCGFKALQYVRYRHEDNDIVRAARQQGFLREARQKVPPSKLLDDRDELIEIFKDYTTSDIDDSGTLVQLFKLMLDARGAQIAQIQFPFDSLDEQGYVTASDKPLQAAISQFLGENIPGTPATEKEGGDGDGGAEKPAGDGEKKPKPEPKPEPEPEDGGGVELIDATASGQQYAALIRDQGGNDLEFPVLYPTGLVPMSGISDDTRYFGIDGGNGKLYHGYKFVMTMPGTTYPTAYYGVSGTDWLAAPLFENPSDRRKIGEREYLFFTDAGQLRMLAFERNDTMYWVTNTLDKLLSEEQMIAIAQNLAVAE